MEAPLRTEMWALFLLRPFPCPHSQSVHPHAWPSSPFAVLGLAKAVASSLPCPHLSLQPLLLWAVFQHRLLVTWHPLA